jgi:oligopeptide transport system substrate-binding protein
MRNPWFMMRAAYLVVTLSVASGCTVASESPYFGSVDPPEGQQLRFVSGSEPESLDPPRSSGQPEARIHMALFDGLTEFHPQTSQPFPSMAERWEAFRNNTEYVFHLRPNLRWSNGHPIVASDFVYSLRRALSPELASRSSYMAYDIEYAQAYNEGGMFVRNGGTGAFVLDPASPAHRLVLPARSKPASGQELVPVRAEDIGIEALDDRTLRIRLMRPIPFLAGLLTHQFFRPVPREAVERHGDAWTRPGNIVTSGAFTLQAWRPYDRLVVVRNPYFWDAARVRLDRITFYPLDDQTTIMNLYKAGEVDAVLNHTPPAPWVDTLRTKKDYVDKPEVAIEFYTFNTKRPPMNDVRVRKAFNAAVDKAAVAYFKRTAKPLTAFTPEGIFPGYPQPKGDPFDPVAAKKLLVEAGYGDSRGDFDPSRFPVADVELIYNTSENNRAIAEFVQAQWRQNLGLVVPIRNIEWRTYLDTMAKLEYTGLARRGWIGDYMDPFSFLALFSTPAGDNGTGWFDRKFVGMIEAANRESDPQKRYELLAAAEKVILDVQPVLPLLTQATNWVKKPFVKGMFGNPATMHAWKFVYIEHDRSKWDAHEPDPVAP